MKNAAGWLEVKSRALGDDCEGQLRSAAITPNGMKAFLNRVFQKFAQDCFGVLRLAAEFNNLGMLIAVNTIDNPADGLIMMAEKQAPADPAWFV